MKALHLKNKQDPKGFGLLNLAKVEGETNVFRSGFWDIDLEDAKELVGGMLYLHEAKAKPSRFGGRVLAVEQIDKPEFARSKRIVFTIEATLDGKNVKWRGADHAMASYGGVIDVEG